jgi:bifunctional DNA-binding transcriptional regulator/antitoxin component of YhaV-PrlF toxin-antitoxin module
LEVAYILKKRKQGKKEKNIMLAKITSKNQLTIPKKIMDKLPGVKYMEIVFEDGEIRLKPVRSYDTDLKQIRDKMKMLDLNPDSVNEALKWARKK